MPLFFPSCIKKIYRFARYRNERKKTWREISIRKEQNIRLRELYNRNTDKLIVFIVPGSDWKTGVDNISGGVISIVSICEETALLEDIHQASTILCTLRNDHLLLKHSRFENNTWVFRVAQLPLYFTQVKEIIIQLPEFLVEHFFATLLPSDRKWLSNIRLHINIMNQNVRLMPDAKVIQQLKEFTNFITITTAHQKYCTAYYRNHFDVPLHKLSVWISPEQYNFFSWSKKRNIIMVSPDLHPQKEEILHLLSAAKNLQIQVVQNLTYDQYKQLASDAKWTLTFGEGLDGYFIEPVFSGAIAFAVYNEDFFTPDFASLETVYPSFETLKYKIIGDIERFDKIDVFSLYQQTQYNLCAQYYSKEQYRKNIASFYRKEYTYE